MKKLKVAVVMGGRSSEYDISISSGKEVIKNLNPKKYEVLPYVISRDGKNWLPAVKSKLLSPKNKNGKPLININDANPLAENKVDLAFIAMHGENTEDGSIQGLFELIGISYTGPRLLSAALTMDKIVSRKFFKYAGLNVPKDVVLKKGEREKKVWGKLTLPCVVKPHNQGSSIGVSIVRKKADLKKALNTAWKYSSLAIVEEYIKGVEVAGAVLGNENPIALPLVEIVPKKEFFDYEAKYSSQLTDEICPARLSKSVTKKARHAALTAYKALNCTVFSRVDMILKGSKVYVLEINPIPGLTPASLLPKAAKAAGISYSRLLDKIINFSLENAR